jgi:hypothetical protein
VEGERRVRKRTKSSMNEWAKTYVGGREEINKKRNEGKKYPTWLG